MGAAAMEGVGLGSTAAWRFTTGGSGCEALDRLGFAVVAVENRDELRDHQEVLNALRHVQELQAAVLAADARVGAHDLAEAGAVDVRHPSQFKEILFLPLTDKTGDFVFENFVPSPKS